MTLVEDMFKIKPKRNPIFTAVENLETPEKVKEFYADLIQWYKEQGWDKNNPDTNGKSPEELAVHNVGYILGYYNRADQDLWYGTLQIGHPFFGRSKVSSVVAFDKGVELGRALKKSG